MNKVLHLPNAGMPRIFQHVRPGRYPRMVTKLRTGIWPGDTVVVTTGPNAGKWATVVKAVPLPSDAADGYWVEIQSIASPFTGLADMDSGEAVQPSLT